MKKYTKLLEVYHQNKSVIKNFLSKARKRDDKHILTELMFCLLTAQTKAAYCRKAVNKIDVFNDSKTKIRSCLEGIRFARKKAEYLFEARKMLPKIKANLSLSAYEQREWLVKNVNGMGMKLASHFLRNIGVFGLAILDVHIQRFMKNNFAFVGEIGKLTKTQYLKNEKIFLEFSKKVNIKPEALDIVIWIMGNSSGNFYG